MNTIKSYKLGIVCLLLFAVLGFDNPPKLEKQEIDEQALLDRHNYYRKLVNVPPLVWSDDLATVAQEWANHLAKSCDLVHSDSEYGENIYWVSNSSTEEEVVDSWASEKKDFNPKNRILTEAGARKYGHYSQMIWRNTTEVGGAMQKCHHGGEMWVCNYNPAGNMLGDPVY
jgi:pathogenesis-related protein 1